MITIYCVSNLINGKCYIGQTRHPLDKRWNGHRGPALRKSKTLFHLAIRKHGPENFSRVQIFRCTNQDEADIAEKYFISAFRSNQRQYGYNCTPGGHVAIPNEATRAKISRSRLGKPLSFETKAKLRAANLGKKASPETCRKLVASSRRGQKNSALHCARISAGKTGKGRPPLSPEWRAKIGAANKGKNTWSKGCRMSAETCAKKSAALRGVPWSQSRRDAENRRKTAIANPPIAK